MHMDAFEQLAADILWNEVLGADRGEGGADPRRRKSASRATPRRGGKSIWSRTMRRRTSCWHWSANNLNSGGVHAVHFAPGSKYAHRYKLFHDEVLRTTILERLRLQCVERGLCPMRS
ncbi:hypothetical protein AB5I41_10220 [Sphingomonas sp. MMS24-JH45]